MTPQRALLSRLAAHVACPVVLIPEWCRNTREMLLNSMWRAGESLVADMHSLSVRLGLRRLRPWSAVDGAVQAQWLSKGAPAGADRTPSGPTMGQEGAKFDPKQLDRLVCPLSKAKLRWDEETSELICDELGIAYPIVNGIPHLTPESGRVLNSPLPGAAPGDLPAQPS